MTDISTSIAGGRLGNPPLFLRRVLKVDAIVTGANGAAYLAAAAPLSDLLGLSPTLLRGVGAFLLAFAAAVWFVGTRRAISPAAVIAIAAFNGVWVLESLLAAVVGWGSPTTAGTIWIVLQAVVVGGFVALQMVGLRRDATVIPDGDEFAPPAAS